MFWVRKKGNSFQIRNLIWRPASNASKTRTKYQRVCKYQGANAKLNHVTSYDSKNEMIDIDHSTNVDIIHAN